MARTRSDVYSEPIVKLSEQELQDLFAGFEKRFKRLEDQYLAMVGMQLRDIGELAPSDVHVLEQYHRMNQNIATLERRIGLTVGLSESDVDRLLRIAATKDIRIAKDILGIKDKLTIKENPYLERVLEAQKRETGGAMKNLSNTTVVSRHYRIAVDEAVQAVQSGVDGYNGAIKRVVREVGVNGLRVTYETGRTRRLDTAARMNVLDGMRHVNQNILHAIGTEFGADGVEIDAHMLCAEDHLPYQGQQYSNEDFDSIQDSLSRPFGEWNCRHIWHPIILGVSPRNYSDDELEKMKTYSTERVDIDGRTKTRYEWSQEMRRLETAVRQQKDVANVAKAVGDNETEKRCKAEVLRLNREYRRVSSASGLRTRYDKTFVGGYETQIFGSTLSK